MGRGDGRLRQGAELTAVADGLPGGERRAGDDRRTHSLLSFTYGGLRPRRRLGRRDGDEHRIFLDWHEPRVLYLALAILLMSCLDALLTLNILTVGGRELNGLMDWLIRSDVAWFIGVKIGVTGLAISLLVVAVNRHLLGVVPVIRILQLVCLGYLLLMAWELYLLMGMFPNWLNQLLGVELFSLH
jgi:hypothetical protein